MVKLRADQRPAAGIVFALAVEADPFASRVSGSVSTQAGGLTIYAGSLAGRQIVWVVAGAGEERAAHAAGLLIDGHRPHRMVSPGFAGGLVENLPRGSLATPQRVLRRGHEPIALAPWPENILVSPTATTLLTADSIATTSLEKRALAQATGADLVDMETWGVARRAMAAGLDCHSLRVISDAVDDQLPPEVARLVQPQSALRRLGAACAALGRRPGAAVDLWRLWEHAVVDGKSLAVALEQLCGSLPVSPPA